MKLTINQLNIITNEVAIKILAHSYYREIDVATTSDMLDIPINTCYLWFRKLIKNGLIKCVGKYRRTFRGSSHNLYRSTIDIIKLFKTNDGYKIHLCIDSVFEFKNKESDCNGENTSEEETA